MLRRWEDQKYDESLKWYHIIMEKESTFPFSSWKQLWVKIYKPRQLIKIRDIPLLINVHLVKAIVFPVVMYAYESWIIKKAECQRIYSFELWCWRTLENPLNCREIKSVNPKGSQPWIFIRRIYAEVEVSIICAPEAKGWVTGKDPDAGQDWRQKEKGVAEDEMVR